MHLGANDLLMMCLIILVNYEMLAVEKWCGVSVFSKSIYSFIRPGTQVRYGINGWIPFFVSHLSQHLISFPNSYSNNLLSLSHPDHSRTIQPLSHFPTDFLPTAALIPSSASEQPKWLQKAEMTCWALLSSHHLHKKSHMQSSESAFRCFLSCCSTGILACCSLLGCWNHWCIRTLSLRGSL